MPEIKHHPLMFTFQDAIAGNGFLAGTAVCGRALMVQEDDGSWWMYGVRPGALAGGGATLQEAYANFRSRYKEILIDIAHEYDDFTAFKNEVERFFGEADTEEEHRWTEALELIRSSGGGAPAQFADLPRKSPEQRPIKIVVERLDDKKQFTPKDNVPDKLFLADAA